MAYKKKWDDFFLVLDANNSGTITREDGPLVAKKLTAAFGIPEGSAEDKKLEAAFRNFIDELVKNADSNHDGKVTKAEFDSAYHKFVVGKVAIPAWFHDNVNVSFDAFDANNNNELTEAEIVKAVRNLDHHVSEETVKHSYHHALKGSHAKVTKQVFNDAVWKYFSSHDATPELDVLFPAFRPLHK